MNNFWKMILTWTAALWIYAGANNDANTTAQTSQKVQWICSEILMENEQASKSLEFWIAFVKNTYPKTQRWSLVRLIDEINSFEKHPIVGEFAQSISKSYVEKEAPINLKDVNSFVIEQMQANLWEIMYNLVNYSGDSEAIRYIGKPIVEDFRNHCLKTSV